MAISLLHDAHVEGHLSNGTSTTLPMMIRSATGLEFCGVAASDVLNLVMQNKLAGLVRIAASGLN
jgi:hypothetical protein